MAHNCPDCEQLCYCNGDIDDCCHNFPEDVLACTHWKECSDEYNNSENYENDYSNDEESA